jgi:hypothetical protein
MNFTQVTMINNSIRLAEYKLTQHKEQGLRSSMDIFEVAHLMDMLKNFPTIKNPQSKTIFYDISAN